MVGEVTVAYGGSGTTVAVAVALGRRGIMIELNPQYCELARKRIEAARLPLLDPAPDTPDSSISSVQNSLL